MTQLPSPQQLQQYQGQLTQESQSGAPLALPSPTDASMANLEYNAQQLFANSISNTGMLPNPQFAAEALATGSTSDNVSAYGDPMAAPYLTAGAPGSPGSVPTTGMPDVYSFNPNIYNSQKAQQVNANQQFSALGEVPIANVGYYQSILKGNKNEVQSWQSWLVKTGYLPNHPVNGYMDGTTQNALQAYFVNMFMPTALYSKDYNQQLQATQFLQSLGYDPTQLNPAMHNDPNFQTQLLAGWIQTQGAQDPRKALNDYASQFGKDSIPAGVQQAAAPSLLQGAEDTGWNIVGLVPGVLSLITSPLSGGHLDPGKWWQQHGPGAGQANNIEQALKNDGVNQQDISALSPLMNQVTGDTGWLPFDWIDRQWNRAILTTSYFIGDNAYAGKDPKNNNPFDPSSPLGQHIASYQNDLGAGLFGQDWADKWQTADHLFNFAADSVDPAYWLGGEGAELKRLTSIFEKTGLRSAEAGVISVPKILRVGAPVVSGQRVIGDVAKLGGKAIGITAGKLINDLTSAIKEVAPAAPLPSLFDGVKSLSVKDVLTQGGKDMMAKATDYTGQTIHAFADAITKVAQNEDGDDALRVLLGIYDPKNPEEEKAVETALKNLEHIKGAASGQDSEAIIAALNQHFPHRMTGPSALHNMKRAMNAIQPSVIDRMSAGHISRLRALGGMPFTNAQIDLSHAFEGAQQLKVHLNSAGVDGKTIDLLLGKWYAGDSDARAQMLEDTGDVGKAIDSALQQRGKSLQGWRDKESQIRSGSKLRTSEFVKNALSKAPKVKRSTYLSKETDSGELASQGWTASTLNSAMKKQYDEWDSMLQDLHENWGGVMTRGIKDVMAQDPSLDEAAAQTRWLASDTGRQLKWNYDAQVAKVTGMQEALAPTGEERPAPFLTSQLRNEGTLPGSAYSLLAYMHDGKFSLGSYEKMASKMKIDYFSQKWKKLALWQISTQLRVAAGDDAMRLMIDAAQDGYVGTALKQSAHSMFSGFKAVGKTAKAKAVTGKIGRKVTSQESQTKSQDFLDFMQQQSLTNPDFMNRHKYLQDFDTGMWHSATRDDEHYPVLFANNHRIFSNAPEVQAYTKAYLQHEQAGGDSAGMKAAQEFYENDPRGQQAVRGIDGMTPELMAQQLSQEVNRLYPKRTMKKWITGGINPDQFFKLWKNEPTAFSHVVSPAMTVNAHAGILSRLSNATYLDFMEPFINAARGDIMQSLKGSIDETGKYKPGLFELQLRQAVGDDPNWDDARIRSTAAMEARHWAQNNLYQGMRSMTGTALRHVFPFYGATANMTKFFMRQFDKHPQTTANWLRLFGFADSQSKQGNNANSTSSSALLTALGFSPGDTLGSNLSHMFFFTNDGFASFVPGFGPIFGPALNGISKDPTLSAIASSIPGISQQVSMNSGDTFTMFPWLEKTLSGIGLMSPLHAAFTAPIIGGSDASYKAKLDEKYAQMTADNQAKGLPPPTQDEVASELGKEELTGELVGGVLPFMKTTITDATRNSINQARTQFSAATTDTQRDQVINSQSDPQMKLFLQYEDPRTPQSESEAVKDQMNVMGPGTTYEQAKAALGDQAKINKDDLAAANPWLLDYTTGAYQSGVASDTSKSLTAQGPDQPGIAGFNAAYQAGEIAPMTLTQYQNKLSSAWEMQNGWQAYEKNIFAPQQYLLSQVGGDTSSPAYRQFDQQYVQPALQLLKNHYQSWYNQFISTESTPSSLAGYALKSAPLNAVTVWETMPHFTADESQRTIMWRKAQVLRDQASNTLEALQVGKAPQVEQQQVYSGLLQQLDQLAQEYPQYASELLASRPTDWKDIVNYETQLEKTYGYVPTQATGGLTGG